jgi:hypothetical protein
MNELELAEAIAAGVLPSPTPLGGSWLIAMRISGSGVAYRALLGEFCWREPAIWLTDTMCRRWLGVPVVLTHPQGLTLTSGAYQNSVLGAIVHAWIKDDELWGITRIYSNGLAAELIQGDSLVAFDTSPSVVFDPDSLTTIALDGGERLLIEGDPIMLDHLAVIITPVGEIGGVWSKDDVTNLGIKETVDA